MNYIKVLGASGSKSKNLGTTSFQISKEIVVDAGNIINTLGDNSQYINHIFCFQKENGLLSRFFVFRYNML